MRSRIGRNLDSGQCPSAVCLYSSIRLPITLPPTRSLPNNSKYKSLRESDTRKPWKDTSRFGARDPFALAVLPESFAQRHTPPQVIEEIQQERRMEGAAGDFRDRPR